MATVAQLASRPYQEIGYVLFVEGWPVAFTNRVELAGTGGSSWIGDLPGEGEGRTVALGLELPASVRLATGLVESGMLVDDAATFTLVDRDGHLVDLMTDDPGTEVFQRLAPTDFTAPATLIGGGGNSVDLRGRWINGEAIGSGGQRRQFGIFPGVDLPGLDHASVTSTEGTLRASVVRASPRWLEGLPCALYLVRKDVQAGTWPSWQDQSDSGYSLIWWGSLRGFEAESRAWKLQCDGPSSWLRKTLNVTAPTEWRPLVPLLDLAAGEDRIAVAFSFRNPLGASEACGTSAYTASDAITSGQTPTELANQISARLQTLIGTAGVNATFSTAVSGTVSFTDQGLTLRVAENNSGPLGATRMGMLQLRMHKNAWLHLGWHLPVQSAGVSYTASICKSVREVVTSPNVASFCPVNSPATSDWGGVAGAYWEAEFTTMPINWDGLSSNLDNSGTPRFFAPVYGGPVFVLYPDGRQPVAAALFDQPYWTGQLAAPPADAEVSGSAVDAAGFIAVRGPYRTDIEEDGEEIYQLASVSWTDSDGIVLVDSHSRAVMWLDRWLDGRLWGGADAPRGEDQPWAARDGGLQFVPIALLDGGSSAGMRADNLLLRLMLSSGTGSWSGVGDDAAWNAGINAHDDAQNDEGDDREVADLGLCVPQHLIDWGSFSKAAGFLPSGKASDLNKTRVAFVGPFDSQELIESILAPRAWCLGLRGGRYGLFARNQLLDLEDVEVAITAADVAAEPDATPPAERVDFRPFEPLDLVTVSWGATQLGGGEGRDREMTVKSRDPRALRRRGNAKIDVDGRTLLPPPVDATDPSWRVDFDKLWGDDMARWHAEPRAMVTVAVKGDVARDLWPGTVVSYTTDWAATRNGRYGMAARVGRVASVERDLLTLAATCEILIEGSDPSDLRRFGPIARLVDGHATVEARHDSATRRVFCQHDAFGRDNNLVSDVAAFAEPSWSAAGGELKVNVWASYDGVSWSRPASFRVESVNATNNTITYVSGSLSGTIPETMLCVLVPTQWDDQDAGEWPQALFGALSGTDDKFGAGDEPGHRWLE